MTTELILAYLAGAMDSDGYFTIKKSTYHKRVRGDAKNPTYSEKMGLHQVTPEVPHLLKETFGGMCYLAKGSNENSKPLWRYTSTDKVAAKACEMLLPYLRIKKAQVQLILELRESKQPKFEQLSYWFAQEHPNWQDMELIPTDEASAMMGYTNETSVLQAVHNGTLLATDARAFRSKAPRIPRLLVEEIVSNGKARIKPPQLIAWRENLHEQIRELNKIGVNGTSVYFRTGHHKPAE